MKNELFLLTILLIVAFMGLVYWHDVENVEISDSSEGTVSRDAVTYSQLYAVNPSSCPKFQSAINQAAIDDLSHNMTVHISDTYQGNVTVIYGNKTVFRKEATCQK